MLDHVLRARFFACVLAGTGVLGVSMAGQSERAEDFSDRSPVHRGVRTPDKPGDTQAASGAAVYPLVFRTINGQFNNIAFPMRGAAGTRLRRMMPSDYVDGVHAPAAPWRKSPREISNLVAAQDEDRPNDLGLTDYVWQWGQFLDHDIDETPVNADEAFDIEVPLGDDWFDPGHSGTAQIPLNRSAYTIALGARQQLNNITAYIDGSSVYGSDLARANELRTLDDTGHLKMSAGDLLPFNVNGFANAPDSSIPTFFLSGDVRANEQVGLTAMHTLFAREHNYWADQLHAMEPSLDGEALYQRARAIVGAEMQAITYNEFLPRLLGPDGMPPYTGYDPTITASITNVFATAAYRVGHTMLSPQLMRLDAAKAPSPGGHLPLASAFFNPNEIIANGCDSVLRGLANQRAQTVDNAVIDDVRNFLFGEPGEGGFDLASLNIQRGRDHGLPSYNGVRAGVDLPMVTSFAEINPDPEVQAKLAAAYVTVDDIDAWVGLLAEPLRANAFVGETLYRVLRRQFIHLRDGDRFWYQIYLPPPLVQTVEAQTLAVIIRRNTSIGLELQDDVFVIDTCPGDADHDGAVAFSDLTAVLTAWGSCTGCPEDFDEDGQVGLIDLVTVLTYWGPC